MACGLVNRHLEHTHGHPNTKRGSERDNDPDVRTAADFQKERRVDRTVRARARVVVLARVCVTMSSMVFQEFGAQGHTRTRTHIMQKINAMEAAKISKHLLLGTITSSLRIAARGSRGGLCVCSA